MLKHRGFSLVELVIVAVILAIILAVSVPLYIKNAEQAQGAKALEVINQIYTAQMLYMSEYEHYTNSVADLQRFSRFEIIDNDWTYNVSAAQTTFDITATRQNNPAYSGRQLGMDETSTISGTPYP